MFELKDSEDEDYVPEVADRLKEDIELHVEREENTQASNDNEGGEAENYNYGKHTANANGDDADDKISDKNYRIRTRNVSAGGERKSLLFLVPHSKEKNLVYHQRMMLK